MQRSIRGCVATIFGVVILCVIGDYFPDADAAEPALVVNLAGKFKPCGADIPGCEHILLKGDPATEPSKHVYRMAKGFVFVKHWHVSAENLVMVRGTVLLNFEGGREQTLRPGDYAYIPQTLVHWGSCPEDCVFYLAVDGPDSFNVVEESK